MTGPGITRLLGQVLLILVLASWGSGAASIVAFAQGAVTREEPVHVESAVTPEFPTGMTVSAQIPLMPGADVEHAALYYRIGNDDTLNLVAVPSTALQRDGESVGVSVSLNLQAAYVPLGVSLSWFWELSAGGSVLVSTAEESALWMDDRFDWSSHASEQLTLYTYDTSEQFAEWMLHESQAAIDNLEVRYDLGEIEPVAIWIYPDPEAFASTRQVNTRESVSGISYPGASVIAAIVRDGDTREYGRVIPHEISHQAVFHATANPFAPPPLWLDEGIATHYQTGGNEHYAEMVERALESGTLFDITSLNASFPFQPTQATLAYASSWSMIEYLEWTYGPEGIARLINAFSRGLSVDEAIQEALGVSSTELNDAWHQWIAQGSMRIPIAA